MVSTSNFGYNIGNILTEYLDDPFFVVNEKYEFEYITANFPIKNLDRVNLGGKLTDILHPNDFQRGVNFMENISRYDQARENLRVYYGDNYRFYEFKGRTFKSETQEKKYLITAYDITQFKLNEENWIKKEKGLKKLAETMPEIRFWKLLQTKDEKSSFQKSREMLDLVIDNIPQFIYWKNKEMVYVGCNKNYALVNNLNDPNFIVGKTDNELPWSRLNFNRIHERERILMQNNQSESIIESWILPDGNEVWYEINRIPLHNIANDIVGILCTYNDMTNRVKAERNSVTFEKKYKQIIDNIKEAFIEVDLKGNFTFVNNSFLEMIGYSLEEIIGQNYRLFVDHDNKEIIFNHFNSVYRTEIPKKLTRFEFIKKNGTTGMLETSIYLNQDASGNKKGFYGIAREITQTYTLEQKLKQSEEKYRHLFENSPYAIWIIDLNGIIVDCNPSTNIILSRQKKKDLINKNFVEILGLFDRPEYFVPFFKNKFDSLLKDVQMKPLEIKMTNVEGIEKWMNIRSSKIKLGSETLIQVIVQDITEKKKADLKLQRSEEELQILNKELELKVFERTKELRESEEKFRTIAESSLMGIAIIQDNRIKYVNQLSTNLTGYTVDETKELSPAKVFEFIHPEDRKWVVEQLRKKQSGASDYITNYQYRIINKSGEIRWLDNYSKTIEYMGKPADMVSVVDITDRVKAEQELKESEEKFRTITEYSSIGIIIIQNNKVKYVNKAMSSINEFTMDEMNLWSPEELINIIHPEDRKQALKYLKGRQEGASSLPPYNSYRILTKNGKVKWVDSYGKTITFLGQNAVLALISDVTDQNLAKLELKESEEKYRHLFEHSPFSIVLMDYNGKIVDMNTKTTELFGYKKEDIIDKNYLTLTGVFPNDTKLGLRLVRDLMSQGEPDNPIMKPQITEIYNKEKKLIWTESELSRVSISGRPMIQVIIQDITEKKFAEEKLKESERILREQNLELKELDRLKTDFISIAAHDLKTPLISVGGYVDLILLREKGLKEEIKEDLNRVLNNVRRLEKYINRLLDVMKIEAKKVELVKREENIHEIIIKCLSDLEFQVSQKDLSVNVDISKNLRVRVDHFRFSEAFLNLLSNAVKFTPKNGKIDISIVEEDKNVLFKIKDNGKGLTPEEIQKLFGKFVTIEQGVDGYSTLDKGTGLGLYIAKGFIEAHGGKIWVESKGRDLGSEFSFTLPKK